MLTHRNITSNLVQIMSYDAEVIKQKDLVILGFLPLYHIYGLMNCLHISLITVRFLRSCSFLLFFPIGVFPTANRALMRLFISLYCFARYLSALNPIHAMFPLSFFFCLPYLPTSFSCNALFFAHHRAQRRSLCPSSTSPRSSKTSKSTESLTPSSCLPSPSPSQSTPWSSTTT